MRGRIDGTTCAGGRGEGEGGRRAKSSYCHLWGRQRCVARQSVENLLPPAPAQARLEQRPSVYASSLPLERRRRPIAGPSLLDKPRVRRDSSAPEQWPHAERVNSMRGPRLAL